MRLFLGSVWFSLASMLASYAALVDDPMHHAALARRAERERPVLPGQLSLAGNALVNADFASSLSGWSSSGDVQVVSAEAVLADTTANPALLYQQVGLTGGLYTITFDYQSGLSSNTAPGNFPDTFFASLYFINGTGTIDVVNGIFDDAAGLMDLDASGVFNLAGLIGPSAKGPDWHQFSYQFNLAYDQVAVAFELAGINGTPGDSAVRIDNVSIVLVPEPASLLLMIGGAGLLAYRRRRA